jgi:hypothetical protein
VFADELYFCHKIPFKGRLEIDTPTISTTDLLLEKMQIVEINLKDFKRHDRPLLEHAPGNAKEGHRHIDMPSSSTSCRRIGASITPSRPT